MMGIKDFIQAFNDQHIQLVREDRNNNTSLRDQKISKWLEDHILLAKQAYYDQGVPVMTDEVYDKMETWLKLISPDSQVLNKVGN